VRALHDPVWTADGYVSDRWRPVSPVSGRLDAFQWQTPLAALPSDKETTVEPSPFEEAMLAPPRRVEPPREPPADVTPPPATSPPAQDNSPALVPAEPSPTAAPAAAAPSPPQTESPVVAAAPLFRQRQDIPKNPPPSIPAVIPIVRAPDDPGIDDEPVADEFAEQISPPKAQAGGWRGFLSRWGS
jgi:HemY protein